MPHTIGQAWVDADQVLPLLDGLDEVQSEHRAACADAINTFRRDHGLLPLAVCSRITEYGARGSATAAGAIVAQPSRASRWTTMWRRLARPWRRYVRH